MKFSHNDVAKHIFNSARLRTVYNDYENLPAETGIPNPESRKFILYCQGIDVSKGLHYYNEIKFQFVATFYDSPPHNTTIKQLKECDIFMYPDHEVLLYNDRSYLYAEAGLIKRLSQNGIHLVTRRIMYDNLRLSRYYYYKDILCDRIDDIAKLYNMMYDDQSRCYLAAYIKGRSIPSLGFHYTAPFNEYYHPECSVAAGDTIIDAGLFDGITTRNFAKAIGDRGIVYGFESDPRTWGDIEKAFSNSNYSKSNVELVKSAVGKNSDFEKNCISIVDFCNSRKLNNVNFIKMDIEGSELDSLFGAEKTIKTYHPKLAICIYHRLNDIFDIPFLIENLYCGYKYYFACHSIGPTSVVLYCSP
jgi:hypothetical protein